MLRRGLLTLPLALAACGGSRGADPEPLPPLVTGYGHLTPIRLDIHEIVVAPPAAGVVRVDQPVPFDPVQEMERMVRERIVAAGTNGTARAIVRAAEFRRERLSGGGMFAGEPGERFVVRLQLRLELSAPDGRSGFIEAEARRQRATESGLSQAQRNRQAETVLRQAMDDLNVELEFQARRNLRGWIVQAVTPPSGSDGVQVEELPRS
ncbi:hypothetical protein [Falsiroseomonas sp. HW251]|uniref:hypothetical protein n=1 Tax=Falsiroseomonas sp. HW251 TaxID=3390998 RepID=UPI003D319FA0